MSDTAMVPISGLRKSAPISHRLSLRLSGKSGSSPANSLRSREDLSLPVALRRLGDAELDEGKRRLSNASSRTSQSDDEWISKMLVLARDDPEFTEVKPFNARIDTGSRYSLTYLSTLHELGVKPYRFPVDKKFHGLTAQKVTPIGQEQILWIDGKDASAPVKVYQENFFVLEDLPEMQRPFDFLLGRRFLKVNKDLLENPTSTTAQLLHLTLEMQENMVPNAVARRLLHNN